MFTLAADVSLRILAAAAAVGLVLVVLRVRSGAARHAAWLAVLLAMLTMPVLTAIVPPVEVPVPSALDFGAIAGEPDLYDAFATPARPDFSESQVSRAAAGPDREVPEEDRLFYLPGAAESAYMRAEYIDYMAREKPEAEREKPRTRGAQGFARARQYAKDALALANRHQQAADDHGVIYRAHTVLGVLALKDGDRQVAVEHMRSATAASISDAGRYTSLYGLRGRLVEYLLREGEREPVAEYLEKSAERFLPERDRLLKDAGQVRAGVMPLSYQYAEARR
jgi:hypothetical protein